MSSGATEGGESTVAKSASGRKELTSKKKWLILLGFFLFFGVSAIVYWLMSGSVNISFFGSSDNSKHTWFALSSTSNAFGAVLVAIGGVMQYKALSVSSSAESFDFARVGALLVGIGGFFVALGAVLTVVYNLI